MATRQAAFEISRADQIRAIASPVRQEIVDALDSMRASTVAALAARLGRKPDALYFHVRALERVGLLRRVGTVGEGRTEAAVFDVAGRPLRLAYGDDAGTRRRRLGPTLDSILRLARRDVQRALVNPASRIDGPQRELWVARVRGWLSAGDLERLNALLAQCTQILHDAPPREDATAIALTFAISPLRAGSRAKRGDERSPREKSRERTMTATTKRKHSVTQPGKKGTQS